MRGTNYEFLVRSRFAQPRCNLFCHHVEFAVAIERWVVLDPCLWAGCNGHEIRCEVALMREQGPGDACVFVGERYRSDVLVASGQQPAQPIIGAMGSVGEMSKHGTRSVDE